MDDINRVARVMVDGEPSADLEARIRARLDEVSAAPAHRAWRTWQVAAGVGAAATIALLVWVQGPGSGVQGPGSGVQGPGSGVQGPESGVQGPGSGVPGPGSRVQGPESREVRSARASARAAIQSSLSAEELAWMERRIPALDPVVALEMDQLAMESIQPEPLAIPPLIMTALPTDGGSTERRE